MRLRPLVLLPLLAACARPSFPAASAPLTSDIPGQRIFELRREVPNVGTVVERVTSRLPAEVEAGACAGRIELSIPGAPGGPQEYTADVGCPDGTNKVQATRTDENARKRYVYQPTLDQMMHARALVLADRSDGVRWYAPDLAYEATSWTAVVHGKGHAHEGTAHDSPVHDRNVVVAFAMHSGFPTPGAHWDDLQLAITDDKGNGLAQLQLDSEAMGTHTAVQRSTDAGRLSHLSYVGLLKDAAGTWRFVDLSIPVTSTHVEPGTGAAAAWDKLVATTERQVLSTNPDVGLGHLWVDGREWLAIEGVGGLVEKVTHRPASSVGSDFALNPAPSNAPTFLLGNAESGSARVSQDATVMADSLGLLTRIPANARAGWAHVHEHFSSTGARTRFGYPLTPDRAPYSARVVEFRLMTGRPVRLVRELVVVKNGEGVLEYGIRQVATAK